MGAQKYFDMIREIKDAAFATVAEDNSPKVRIIDVMLTEDERLYFLTARGKEFYRELLAKGRVAVTGLNKNWEMIRLEGKVKPVGQELLERIFAENPSMNQVYPGDSRYILEVFCLYEGEGEYFSLGQEPIERVPFTFGGAKGEMSQGEALKKGFYITEECIGCGTCQRNCPQQAICEGSPYQIRQQNCLHCGLCMEVCPADAVRRREACGSR